MLDRLATLAHGLWVCIKALLHSFEQMLVLTTFFVDNSLRAANVARCSLAGSMLNSQFKLQSGFGSAGNFRSAVSATNAEHNCRLQARVRTLSPYIKPLALRKPLPAMNSAAGHSGQRLTPGFTFEVSPRFSCLV
jgi:hypothetical protein